jgi:hypothetical protein
MQLQRSNVTKLDKKHSIAKINIPEVLYSVQNSVYSVISRLTEQMDKEE